MSSEPHPRILTSGDTALVVEFGREVDRRVSALVLALTRRLEAAALDGVVELVPTFRSLMVHYDPLVLAPSDLAARLAALAAGLDAVEEPGRLWRLPACYDPAVAPDMADVAAATGMTPAEIAAVHSAETYHVYMLGYLPGFPYMGDTPVPLRLPRRRDPRVKVPPGSIAIATAMTAVYAIESPGGWNLIGRTPALMWDLRRDPPALLAAGDKVRFEPVSLADYEALAASAAAGTLVLTPEPAAAASAAVPESVT
ncbi:5-oxoprolinase subunit PxpB [Rhodoplanes sp. TEM]|uniref:5-oxoprolinase subunit PxpB n=1 Tax=Rhodoplanes tepidamans TaxID=200616 RepID=A0ABT5JH54_RHOTP|nr:MULTISPECIES: 5-oxoprolinase subunit PxpB [Rhodoplanes]MDC7788748.1 5-oxoprolinase subunit PxpB [Rhodoplanes tepidamans]MDC7983433.1 5-oxoprolinase subunit PxpB [Rhodoplanes sp. TEM]MDQ0354569.1 KipI family sensor histidine kinase inhibitor [Rhodoplanes tepidamans]